MKKLTGVISIVMSLMLIISGCGSKDAATNTTNTANTTSTNNNSNQAASGNNAKRQFSRPDLSGQVTMIAGNQVTIKLIEMPQRSNNQNQGQQQGGIQRQGSGQGQSPGQWQGGGQGQGQGNAQGQGQSQRRQLKFTGESKTITIPVGIPITTVTRGQNGIETQNLEFKDIKKGSIMQIWYSEKDKSLISRISISSFGTGSGTGN